MIKKKIWLSKSFSLRVRMCEFEKREESSKKGTRTTKTLGKSHKKILIFHPLIREKKCKNVMSFGVGLIT
jgi:hypothetical protein